MTTFTRLNHGWNAEPNAPEVEVAVTGTEVHLRFLMNPYQFPEYAEEDVGVVTFRGCWRWRHGRTNDEGWWRGQCRFSGIAPAWGEFYEVGGDLQLDSVKAPKDWHVIGPPDAGARHFLFYLRDTTFECDAQAWALRVIKAPTATR